jgi:branched-chain amino acid transport system substrate-binding protein
MTRRLQVSLVLAAGALVAAVTATVALATSAATPGITKTSVTIGGTFPLTGAANVYAAIPAAENAYFKYVNAHGGVDGRKINFLVEDDAYNPAQTVPQTKKLVEQDHVFAVYGSLGTAPILATRGYLNQQKVPQVLVATGDSYWATQYKQYPWTIGFQPDYPGESRVYGAFIRTKVPQAKIGVLMQDDSYGQNYYNGLLAGLGAAKSKIVAVEKYDPTQTDVSQQVVKLRAAGANVFALFALPTQTIDALVVATKIGWKPVTFINNVSASPLFMGLAVQSGANVDGDISTNYLYDTINNPSAPLTKLYEKILSTYDPKANPVDIDNLYGIASAWTFVHALKAAGPNPTRQGLMNALTSMKKVVNPFLYPGITMTTSATDHFLIEQQTLEQWKNGAWHPFGHLFAGAR